MEKKKKNTVYFADKGAIFKSLIRNDEKNAFT